MIENETTQASALAPITFPGRSDLLKKIIDTSLHALVECSQCGIIPKLTFWSLVVHPAA